MDDTDDMNLSTDEIVNSTMDDEMSVDELRASSDIDYDKIPSIDDVWPILEKIGCRQEGDIYYLPRSCSANTNVGAQVEEQEFDRVSLRHHICQYGIPVCSRKPNGGLSMVEELQFKRWVRYSVVPFPSSAVIIPDYGETSPQEVKSFFRDQLRVPYTNSGFFSYGGKKRLDLNELVNIFAREGVDWESHPGLDNKKVCKVMMYVAENKDVDPYAYCTSHRPARVHYTQAAAKTSKDNDGVSEKSCPLFAGCKPLRSSLVTKDWFQPCYPLPQIVVDNLICKGDAADPRRDLSCTVILRQDLKTVRTLIGKYEWTLPLVQEIELKLKLMQPLTQLVKLNPETVDRRWEPKVVPTLMRLGFGNLNEGPQRDVCLAALESPPDDIMCVTPCGLGKSLCFVLPAILQGGITLVIGPLKTWGDNIVTLLSGNKNYDVVALLNSEDAHRTNALLGERESNSFSGKPLIFIVVAELVNNKDNLGHLQVLATKGVLKRIVIDEFDFIEERNAEHREKYTTLVPNIREACNGVPFMFLSGTTTLSVTMKVLALPEHKVTKVFTHARALPNNLVFSVERKLDNRQVAYRISSILSSYLNEDDELPGPLKVLCCCLTRDECKEMKDCLLSCNSGNLDIQVDVITSETNKALGTAKILKAFCQTSSKAVHILCVTKALGRGFHADDIRFVFHTIIPLSLTDYIQDVGRAGRGGRNQLAYCTLFFRERDCSIAANMTNQHWSEELTKFHRDE